MRRLIPIALLLLLASMAWSNEKKSRHLRFAVPDQEPNQNKLLEYLAKQFGPSHSFDRIVFLPWKQIDGTDGILPVLVLEKPKRKPRPALTRQRSQMHPLPPPKRRPCRPTCRRRSLRPPTSRPPVTPPPR